MLITLVPTNFLAGVDGGKAFGKAFGKAGGCTAKTSWGNRD
jgi:hypothetical protein